MNRERSERYSRDRRVELLAIAPAAALVELGERAAVEVGSALRLVREPQIGTVVLQVREPVAEERFYLGDVLVTRAEVEISGVAGWSMRLGDDRVATLAAAVLDAAAESNQPLAEEIERLCAWAEQAESAARQREWQELAATIVQFEKLDQ